MNDYLFKQQLTDMSFWYPIIESMRIPTPETYIIKHKVELINLMDWEKPKWIDELISNIDYYAQKVGYPCFIRTWLTSNKHNWLDTCFLQNKDSILQHLYNLVEFSCLADISCMRSCDTIVIRKILNTKADFTCFNGMPIAREVRLFLRDWKLESIHPYWLYDAFNWKISREKVKKLNTFSKEDIIFFQDVWNFIANQFPWYWSVDFLQDSNKYWFCIDMAVWDNSFKNPEIITL